MGIKKGDRRNEECALISASEIGEWDICILFPCPTLIDPINSILPAVSIGEDGETLGGLLK